MRLLKFILRAIMNAAVKYKVIYKINVMILACFGVKTKFFAFIACLLTCFVFLYALITIGSDITLHSVEEVIKSNDILPSEVYKTVLDVTQCYDRALKPSVQQRGDFWVFYNYIRAENQYRCFESVTYTTQGDYTFLDNIIPLVEHWKGPISVALHAPGDDFQPTLNSIAYLRNCGSSLIKQYVTFHLFFGTQHIPNGPFLKSLREIYEDRYNCSQGAPYENKNYRTLYKTKKNLTYPINVARNIARVSAQTHFVLASDIELYPSPNMISKFLRMVARRRELFEDKNPKIFVLPVFEILANQSVPENKTVLQHMAKSKTAFYFHKNICWRCHAIPNSIKWLALPENEDLNVFVTVKRQDSYEKWEAFYIGTHDDPLFDERLSWEGQSNKMIQAYTLCLLDYDYMVLDNVYMVHKPGLKKQKFQLVKHYDLVVKTNKLLSTQFKTEMNSLYGTRKGCKIH